MADRRRGAPDDRRRTVVRRSPHGVTPDPIRTRPTSEGAIALSGLRGRFR